MVHERRRTRRSGQFIPLVVVRNRLPLSESVKPAKNPRPDTTLAIHQRLRKQAAITRAVLDAWLAGKSMNETFRIARAVGFRGNVIGNCLAP